MVPFPFNHEITVVGETVVRYNMRIQGNDSQVLKIKEISKQEGDIMYEYDDDVLNMHFIFTKRNIHTKC